MKNIIFLCFIGLLCNSCATIFNSKTTKVNIYAPENTLINFDNESILVQDGKAKILAIRSKDSLRFSLVNDTIMTDFSFKRKVSELIYLNFFTPYTFGLGLLVDLTNQKRFRYQKNIAFEIDSTNGHFQIIETKIKPFNQHTTFIYTSPLLAIDVFSQPMVSLGVEYFPLDKFSVSAEYASIYYNRLRDNSELKLIENKGRSFRYEIKYYNLIKLTNNPKVNEYIGLEARFIRQQFNKDFSYSRADEDINYFIREPMAVVKSVDIFNLKYGLNFPIGKRLYLDLYSGLGLRNKTFKNPNSQFNPETDQPFPDDDNSIIIIESGFLEDIDDAKLLNFSLGFKFGIKF